MAEARFLLVQVRPETNAAAQELRSMQAAVGPDVHVDVHPADREPLPDRLFERWQGAIVGGSPFSLTEPGEKSPAQRRAENALERLASGALDRDYPTFFTCFGIGVLTRRLGGVVDRTHPEPVSAAWSRLTPAGRDDDLAGVLSDRFLALTGHKESAAAVPPGAVLLATNDASPVQLYRVGRVVASQFHPEPTTAEFAERARIYSRHGYFPPDDYERIALDLRGSTVTEPRTLLRRFVQLATG